MYILKNAWTSIIRNKGRNILLGIIIVVIACATTVTLAIKNSSDDLIKSYKESVPLTASISMNRKNMMQNFDMNDETSREDMKTSFNEASNLTVEEVVNYGDSNYVSSYYYTLSTGINIEDLEKASSDVQKDDMKMPNISGKEEESNTDFTLTGYSSYEAMNEFITGNYTITDGTISSDFSSYSCVINSELATLNDLEVNDTIKVINPNNSKTYTLTITGIYEENDTSTDMKSLFSNSANTIITNTNVLQDISNDDSTLSLNVTPTYILTSNDVLEDFEAEVTEKGLNEYLSVTTNEEEVANATSTISNVSNYAITFLIITLVIGIIVLFIINMINIRERKYEIGVLRTIGMKKKLVTLEFMSELLIVTLISLLVGFGIGACLSVPISNSLLANEIESSSNKVSNIEKNFGGNMETPSDLDSDSSDNSTNKPDMKNMGVAKVSAYDSINATVSFKVLLELLGIGILLTVISSSATVLSIQKFSPLTILKERS